MKSSLFELTLSVPPADEFASAVGAVVDDVTDRIGLGEEKRSRVRRAIARAFTFIVGAAMAETNEQVHVHFSESADALHVSLRERGLPLDERRAAHDPRWHDVLEYTDCASWRWHGTGGTELRLTFVHQPDVSPHTHAPAFAEIVPEAPDQTYTIRRFHPDDARGVVRCFYTTYGYAYDVPALYEPRSLTDLNKAERYISFVATDEAGEIVGHYALDREPGAPIAEGCGAVVDPHHRGHHLLAKLREAAEAQARDIGLAAYYTEPVTDHTITQKESERSGAYITAISLGFSPRGMLAKHMDLSATSQRQSLTLYVKPLRPPEPRTIYPPANHRDVLAQIYARLEIPVQVRDGAPPDGEGSLHASVLKASGNATIAVEEVGKETINVARQAVADLVNIGSLGAIYAMLPLTDPGTPFVADALEREGFFFSGLAPWMLNGADALRLQRLLRAVDTSELVLASDFGRELLAYIDARSAPVG